jgi:hypothetical protein
MLHPKIEWNDVMPVVEKIESLYCETQIYHYKFYNPSHSCEISLVREPSYTEHTVEKKSNSKIESVWLAVVEFIKWYNQNK